MSSAFDRPDDNVYEVPDDGGTHLSHIPAPPMTICGATGLIYCKACGTLLRSDAGPAKGRRAYEPCRPAKVELREASRPKWSDLFGVDPTFTGDLTADEHLDAGRGEA